MARLFETMKDTVGIDMAEIVKAGTYDAQVNRNVNISVEDGTDAGKAAAKAAAAVAVTEAMEK